MNIKGIQDQENISVLLRMEKQKNRLISSQIEDYLRKYGEKVEIVIMDMRPSFKAAVQKALDKPIIVADRFHYSRYIYWALDGVRRRMQTSWHDYDRKKCKKVRHIFYKRSEDLTEKERWYLNRYRQMSKKRTQLIV